jgi:hypothetical protein
MSQTQRSSSFAYMRLAGANGSAHRRSISGSNGPLLLHQNHPLYNASRHYECGVPGGPGSGSVGGGSGSLAPRLSINSNASSTTYLAAPSVASLLHQLPAESVTDGGGSSVTTPHRLAAASTGVNHPGF